MSTSFFALYFCMRERECVCVYVSENMRLEKKDINRTTLAFAILRLQFATSMLLTDELILLSTHLSSLQVA
jgi:hypothetical protein